MQDIRCKASELAVTNMEVAKTIASFWRSAIPRVVTLFITIIASDFKDVLFRVLAIAFLFFWPFMA